MNKLVKITLAILIIMAAVSSSALAVFNAASYTNMHMKILSSSTKTAVTNKVTEVVEKTVKASMNEYEKALALHDWLTANAQYDMSYTEYEADGVLLNGKGVCQSYALAYYLLLEEAGIESSYSFGNGHMWNTVKIDGEWYHVDVTWDDPVYLSGGKVVNKNTNDHTFFGLSDAAIQQFDNHECLYDTGIVAESYESSYFFQNGDLDEIKAYVQNKLNDGKTSFTYKFSDTSEKTTVMVSTAALMLRETTFSVKGENVRVNVIEDGNTLRIERKASESRTVSQKTEIKVNPTGEIPMMMTIETEEIAGSAAVVVTVNAQ